MIAPQTDSSAPPAPPGVSATSVKRKKSRSLSRLIENKAVKILLSCAVFLLLWELSCIVFSVPQFLVPRPSAIAYVLYEKWGLFATHSIATFNATVGGFVLAVVLGIVAAALIVVFPAVTDVVMPILLAFQIVPKVAIAPILMVWFGYGLFSKILIAFLTAFFPIVVNCAYGLASIEPIMLDLARVNRATRWQVFCKFRIPSAVPHLLSGMKIAITLAVIGAVIGEFVGGSQGLGYLIIIANSELDTAMAFAALFILSAGGIAMYLVVEALEYFAMPWKRRRNGKPRFLRAAK